jgi:hypothetical protein
LTDSVASARAPLHRRRWVRVTSAILLLLALLLIDLAPAVPAPAPPTGLQAERARATYRTVRNALAAGRRPVSVEIPTEDLDDVAALASRLERFGRFAAEVEGERLRLRVSRRLLGPMWLNLRADVEESRSGFPPVALRVGRLPLGERLSRWTVEMAAQALRARGVRLPPLDRIVRTLQIRPAALAAQVDFPTGSGVFKRLPEMRLGPIDNVAAARLVCTLVAAERAHPAADFAEVVRRAFAAPPGDDPVASNRARLAALAVYTAGGTAARVVPETWRRAASCGPAPRAPLLLERADLAKHWAMSAALAVTAGDDVGLALGEWKELADSRPDGTGFSFVDLAADRSGIATGRRALDPGAALELARRLAQARSEELLPVRALALMEGMSEKDFAERYGDLDSEAYTAMIARIDSVLANTVGG